jgi:hypothetical protein
MAQEEDLLNFGGKSAVPAEYQTELRTNQYKRALAEAMLKKETKPVQMFGIHAARQSPLSPLIQILQQRFGMQGMRDADQADTVVSNRAEAASRAELQGVQALASGATPDLKAAIAQATLGRFGRTQQYAGELQKQLKQQQDIDQAKLLKVGELQGTGDPLAGAKFVQGGNLQAPLTPMPLLQPELTTSPAGNEYAITRDAKGGRPVVNFAPKPMKTEVNVDARVGPKTDTELDKETIGMIKKSKDDAGDAQNVISTAIRSNQLLNQGADAGGGASVRQASRDSSRDWFDGRTSSAPWAEHPRPCSCACSRNRQ